MAAEQRLLTVDEFARLPESDDGSKEELVRGRVVRNPIPGARHGLCCGNVIRLVGGYAEKCNLGVVTSGSGVIAGRNPDSVLAPDLAFWSRSATPADTDGWPEIAPDLVVEVTDGPSDAEHVIDKSAIYLVSGVRLVWVVWPSERSVLVRRIANHPLPFDELRRRHGRAKAANLPETGTLTAEDVLPGFSCRVADLFS